MKKEKSSIVYLVKLPTRLKITFLNSKKYKKKQIYNTILYLIFLKENIFDFTKEFRQSKEN